MSFAPPDRVQRRLQRWDVWAALWLARALSVFSQFGDAHCPRALRALIARRLDDLAKHLINTIIIRTAMRPEFQNRMKGGPKFHGGHRAASGAAPRPALRAVIGSDLRRAVAAPRRKGASWAQIMHNRAQNILHALQTRDALIGKLARRLRGGLSRALAALMRAAGAAPDHAAPGDSPARDGFDAALRAARAAGASP